MSDSPSVPISATRAWSGPANQTRSVCAPVIREFRFELPWPPTGSCGSPRSELWTTVPDPASSRAVCRSTSSCAAVRGGNDGSAAAAIVRTAAPPPMTVTPTRTGTPQRSAGRDVKIDIVHLLPLMLLDAGCEPAEST
jgi:hypothetical protein